MKLFLKSFSLKDWPKNLKYLISSLLVLSMVFSTTPAIASNSGADTTKPILKLDFAPSDAIMDPTQPVIYLADGSNNRVIAVNYETGGQSALSFSLKPERLAFTNGELYVTLLKNEHQWFINAPLTGAVAIINPITWTVADQFDVQTDPYSIAVDQKGFIYLTPGSNQWSQMLVYSRTTKEKVATSSSIRAWSSAMLQPGTDKLYTTTTESIPPDTVNPNTYNPENQIKTLGVYRLVNQQVVEDQNYMGQYDHISTPMRFSADGEYLFNGSGEVFDSNFKYVTFIRPFSDISFDPISKAFYTSAKNSNTIQEYEFNNKDSDGLDILQPAENYQSSGQVAYLFYRTSQLMAVSKNLAGSFFIETIPVSKREVYTPDSSQKRVIPLNFTPTQTIIDPENPILYFTDQANNKVYAVNYLSQEIKSVQLDFPPERIAYENGELYVTLLKGSSQHWDNIPGSIQILKADTLQPVDRLDLDMDPSDVIVKDGNIIVIPGPKSNGRVTRYSRQTKQVVSQGSFLLAGDLAQLHPTLPRVYTVDTVGDPHDLHYFSIENGKLGDSVTWPNSYHSLYGADVNFRVSLDGNYVFDGNGEVFDQDLNHVATLGYSFKDFAFSADSKRIYALDSWDPIIHIYDTKEGISPFSEIGSLTTLGEPQTLFCRDDQLIAISSNEHRDVVANPVWIEFLPLKHDPNDGSLTVRGAFPLQGSEDSSINTPLMLAFNETVFVGDPTKIIVRDANGQAIPTVASLEAINNLLLVTFDHDLHYDSSYSVTIPGSAGVDAEGQGFGSQVFSLDFKTGQEFNRLGGNDRYDTAVKISQAGWKQASNVVLATGENFPDALSAAPLARKYNAPILLTTPNGLPKQIESEFDRLDVRQVFIVGGYAVVSKAIEEKLQAQGIKTVRLAGFDCYATSVAIADYLGPTSQIFVANGDSFPDALSIASYAAREQIPILLTTKDSLPTVVKDYLKHNRITKTYLVGGEAVVSLNVSSQFENAERIAGFDRYETNLAALERFGFDFSETFLATGENFPDALTGSALAGVAGNPIILVSHNTSPDVMDILRANQGIMKMKYILGGEVVVPSSLLDKMFN